MKKAKELSKNPTYLATARNWDTDFENRIKRHQSERSTDWYNIEKEKDLSELALDGKVVVVDCITLWLTNLFVDAKQDVETCLGQFKQDLDSLIRKDCTFIFISNEIGMGLHAETASGRRFTDLQGWANQYVAKKAEEAILMVSGLPLSLKKSS